MDEDALVVAEIAELVWFDFVLLGFGVVHVVLVGAESPRPFYHALLADEVGGLNGIGFIGGAEDEAIARDGRMQWVLQQRRWALASDESKVKRLLRLK